VLLRTTLLLASAGTACLAGGCGTVLNLTAPATATPQGSLVGPASCEPFGGVERSSIGGQFALCPPWTPIGVWILVVDTPLSLVGDTVTLPLVYARKRGEPWATWWGRQKAKEQGSGQEGE
jgi:uncharacterized protein YceK